jgi:hypothetical protein
MAQNGVLGDGVKVAYSASSPITWVPVGQILDVGFPGLTPDEVETTVHSTTRWKRFIRGMIDVGETTLTLLADMDSATGTDQQALFTYQAAGTTLYWRIEVPVIRAGTSFAAFEFQAWVKKWELKTPMADKQVLECSLRFDGTYFNKLAAGASAF